jgi:hypothetical protein
MPPRRASDHADYLHLTPGQEIWAEAINPKLHAMHK